MNQRYLVLPDAKDLLDEMPAELRRQVVDYAEFLMARARRAQGRERTWDSLIDSLDCFSEDYMVERCQPGQRVREAL